MISMSRKFNVKLVAPIYFEQIKLSERYLIFHSQNSNTSEENENSNGWFRIWR